MQIRAYSHKGWSDEPYPIYSPASNGLVSSKNIVAFSIERASLPLFGFANFGCLLTGSEFFGIVFLYIRLNLEPSAFFRCSDSGKTMLWIPRRSRAKRTFVQRI